jgi:Gas vesicle synthesis protein GvpL/GvpF
MPTYLYCVLPATAEEPPLMPIGIGGAPTRVLRADPVAAWVETVRDRAVPPTVERVKAHDAVAETALMTGSTPLPVRFGQVFESDDACVAALRARESRLLADLADVSGLVEMRVIIALVAMPQEPAPVDAPSPGRAYMQRLMGAKARERATRSVASSLRNELRRFVGRLVQREAVAMTESPPVLTLSHLVSREDVDAYRTALRDASFRTPIRRFVVTGPGAPYEFVSPPE